MNQNVFQGVVTVEMALDWSVAENCLCDSMLSLDPRGNGALIESECSLEKALIGRCLVEALRLVQHCFAEAHVSLLGCEYWS